MLSVADEQEQTLPCYRVESCVIDQPAAIEPEWLDLQSRAECSYFQSWGWIGTWLEQIAVDLQPILVNVLLDERRIGMGLFVPCEIKRHIIIHTRAMFLHEYPYDGMNMVIEYNGLLAERGHEQAVYTEIIGYLLREYREYDEFYFGAIAEGSGLESLKQAAKVDVDFVVDNESISWQVNLAGLEPTRDACLVNFSKNRRGQIRRSFRLYEQTEPLQLHEAQNTDEALAFLDGLKVLHTQRWQSKGTQGAFANPLWETFHRSLIQNRFEKSEIQLLKVGNSRATVGYLYNFVWRDRVYVLQTGFRIPADKRYMPGYVIHILAIMHNKAKNMVQYDLMHGDSLYKRILCNQGRKLYWTVMQRRRLKFGVEKLAADIVRHCRLQCN